MPTHRQLFLSALAPTSPAPMLLEVERATGCVLYTTDGKEVLDLIAGISVCNVGHTHPAVVRAIEEQARRHMHVMVYGEVVQQAPVEFAAKLSSLLPPSLNCVYFTNSGAEATEGAMKLAKRITGRTQFVSFKNSYHGSTQGALSVMGDESFKQSFRPLLPDVLQLMYGDENELEKISCRTAAVICEPVQAESGVTVPQPSFIQKLRQRCDETGALLIIDEAQTAFGRTGKMFAFEHYNTVPDVLLLAKALGGGMPLGAFIASHERMNALASNPVLGHITTFGGHPVSCAAGHAALNVLMGEKLMGTVEEKGLLFEKLLRHSRIKDVRRKGLMIALEFESFDFNKRVIDACLGRGLFTDWFLFAAHCLRIAPPLIVSSAQIEKACDIILESIQEVTVA